MKQPIMVFEQFGEKPLDNRLINLEWCTDSDNKKHAYQIGLMKGGNQHTGKVKKDLLRYKIIKH